MKTNFSIRINMQIYLEKLITLYTLPTTRITERFSDAKKSCLVIADRLPFYPDSRI